MFDITELTELTGTNAQIANLTELDAEQCSSYLIAESVLFLAKPLSYVSESEFRHQQDLFNREVALSFGRNDGSTSDSIMALAKDVVMRVTAAQQSGVDETIEEMQKTANQVVGYLAAIAKGTANNGFYRHAEIVSQEPALADANPTNQAHVPDGANHQGVGLAREFATKSDYAGWRRVTVEADVMEKGTRGAVDTLLQVITALLPYLEPYARNFYHRTADGIVTSAVMVQLGYDKESKSNLYSVTDVWETNRAKQMQARTVHTASDSLKFLSSLTPAPKPKKDKKAKAA